MQRGFHIIGGKYEGLLGVIATLTLALVACGDAVGPNPSDVKFASSLGIDLEQMTETASGLYIRDDVVGVGEPAVTGDQVVVDFTGWLADGTEFDSGELPILSLGSGLIDGFTEGVTGMRAEGTRTIVLPADLAYGPQGRQGIPGNAVLVFKITVTSIVKPQ
jgi:FKBP-type peptidyl-prolyl cis-trans isomerase